MKLHEMKAYYVCMRNVEEEMLAIAGSTTFEQNKKEALRVAVKAGKEADKISKMVEKMERSVFS